MRMMLMMLMTRKHRATPCGFCGGKTGLCASQVPHLCRPDRALGTHGPGVLLVDSISNGHLVAELSEVVPICHCMPPNRVV